MLALSVALHPAALVKAQCSYRDWVQDLVAKVAGPGGQATGIVAKVQGPFEGENMSAAEELIYTHMVVFAGGIGATAVMPMVKSAAMRRSRALPGVFSCVSCMRRGAMRRPQMIAQIAHRLSAHRCLQMCAHIARR